MKSLSALLLSMTIYVSATAQNIVPNPNFSLHTSCPDDYSEVDSVMH